MINNGRFEIFLRRRQNVYNDLEKFVSYNAIVQCDPVTGFAQYIPGNVDNITSYAGIVPDVDGWYNFSNYIEDLEKLSFSWDKINSGNSSNSETNQDGSNYDKGVSSDLLFFDSAYQFIYDWLITTECQILNCVEVKIVDLIAGGTYRLFEIKNDNLEYAPVDNPCQFRIKLRERDNVWHCVHKEFIWDDWQGWFKKGFKEHPCFLTVIEPRPRLVSSARMALLLFYHSNPLVGLIDFITGFDLLPHARKILNANRFVDSPLVSTYIENVSGKCGLTHDTIFDETQDWENLCLYYPQAGFMWESDDDDIISPSLAYNFDNRWLITIAELFDKLKVVFGAEWYITPLNKIIFKYTKDLIQLLPIYDFTLPGAEPIYNLVYTFNGDKKPAYGRYEYQDDGSDLASQEMSTLYSDIIDYDGPRNNEMLEGEKSKSFEFAPTGFVRDGRSRDYLQLLIDDGQVGAYILAAVLVVVAFWLGATAILYNIASGGAVATSLAIFGAMALWAVRINNMVEDLRDEFVRDDTKYTGAVRLTSEQTLTPRLILWDGVDKRRAKAEHEIVLPTPNAYYNPDLVPYNVKNKIDQDNTGNVVYNYPLYFDGDFQGNLFDRFHDVIDNPLKSKESHQDAKWNVDLCEDMLHTFGVFENEYAQIGKIVKLEARKNYDVYVRIGNINVDYDDNKINLRGTVLRRISENITPVSCSTFQINSRCLIINGTYININ